MAATQNTFFEFSVAAGEQIVIEVLDNGATAPQLAFPGRVTLGWSEVEGAYSYRVEEYVGAAWTARQTVRDLGQSYFSWVSRFLEDATSHQFRVITIGTNGVEGEAKAFTFLMVRHPDIPDVAITYDEGTQRVTVT